MAKTPEVFQGDFSHGHKWRAELDTKGWWHSFELPDGTFIDGVCDLASLKQRLAQFPIPENLSGKRVLDIGAWDGWFSFEMERRGADVVAIDCWDNPRFRTMHALLGSRVDYRQLDMFELTPDRIGHFDIVLFMGVLYHLKHPLLALERVCALATDLAAVDSYVLQGQNDPVAGAYPVVRYFETTEFGGNPDNWVAPNLPALLSMCRIAGFARVELTGLQQWGASVACYRRWPAHDGSASPTVLEKAIHHLNYGINFRSDIDDYVLAWFHSPESDLSVDNVRPSVGPFGARPSAVQHINEDRWQVNFKFPPQVHPGWHAVTVCIKGSSASNACKVALDLPLHPGPLEVTGATDAVTWKSHELDLAQGNALSIWVRGLPENADCGNLRARLGAAAATTDYVEPAPGSGDSRQVNLVFPTPPKAGKALLEIRLLNQTAPPVEIVVTGEAGSN